MNVLYVDHTSLVSGAQRALLDLLAGLPLDVVPTLMCPKGRLADIAREMGINVVAFAGTSGSLRLHPWHTVRAGGEIVASALMLRRAAAVVGADVIHANSIRAGLIAGCARRLGGPPTVVHIHDALPETRAADFVRRSVRANADAIITISDFTTLNFVGPDRHDGIHMLFNPLDVATFDPDLMTKQAAREALGIEQDAKLVGLIAQITPWKGQDTAIRALQLIRDRQPTARLLLVGETKFVDKATRYDNLSFERWLYRLVRGLQLEARVEFWGQREDIPTIMRALDVLLTPSWEEPFGRSVIEGMAMRTATIATNVGGPPEFIRHGVDGLLIAPRDVTAWAVAIERLLNDPALRDEIAVRGSAAVRERFDRRDYVSRVLEVYDEIAVGPSRLARRHDEVRG